MINRLFDHVLELDADGKMDTTKLPCHGGVYLIADADERPIFLAFGQSLRRVVAGRLCEPAEEEKTRRINLAELAAKIYWTATFSRFEAEWAHWRISRQLDPKHYRETLSFGPCWFVRLHINDAAPHFTTVKTIGDAASRHAGPFPTRASADAWIHMLQDAFDLCRHHKALAMVPAGERCAYYDMEKCAAPCDGTLPMDEYRSMLQAAFAFTIGDRRPKMRMLDTSMRRTAEDLEFERASAIRVTIEKTKALIAKPEYEHVGDMNDWSWLIVQRAGPPRKSDKTAMLKPFYVRGGSIVPGQPTALANIDTAVAEWSDECRKPACAQGDAPNAVAEAEAIWLVAKYLYQAERAPGLFLQADSLPSPAELAARVRKCFADDKETTDGSTPADTANGDTASGD